MLVKNFNQEFETTTEEINQINSKILPFLRYENHNLETLDELYKVKQNLLSEFLQKSQKKESLAMHKEEENYMTPKLKAKKLGIAEPSTSLTVMRYHIGYLSSTFCSESRHFFTQIGNKLGERWKDFLS